MPVLEWDKIGERDYETGASKGVLYPYNPTIDESTHKPIGYKPGVAWSGLRSVSESPSGAEPTKIYADNIQYLTMFSAEEFSATIAAYFSPEEFDECDGSVEIADGVTVGQQERKTFGFSYQTIIGNDTEGNNHGYKIHLVYGCKASPSERTYNTVNDSPEANELSWSVSTTPVDVPGKKPTATVIIDSTKVSDKAMAAIEAALYGTDSTDAYLPTPAELLDIITAAEAEEDEDPDVQG